MEEGVDIMNKQVSRYFQLKQKQKLIEQELSQLKDEIVKQMNEQDRMESDFGSYRVKLVASERKEYHDQLLYNALPDKELWRLLSKPDQGKITGLLKVGAISDDILRDTYTVRHQLALLVDKK